MSVGDVVDVVTCTYELQCRTESFSMEVKVVCLIRDNNLLKNCYIGLTPY